MANEPTRFRRSLKTQQGRILQVERLVGRLERRIERLEKQNAALKAALTKKTAPKPPSPPAPLVKQSASLKAELQKLRGRVDQNARDLARVIVLREPVQALVRSFKQAPGAPFEGWRAWMLATFRKQGVYRRSLFR